MRRFSLQRSEPIVMVIATSFEAIVIVANAIMGIGFRAKVFVVVVLKGWD
jgi:hypothetical protein